MFEEFDLIRPYENDNGYYDYQKQLLNDIENDPEKILELAILQTLSPIGNYEVATEILKYTQDIFDDKRVSLIGFYISVIWYGKPSVFIDKMMFFYRVSNEEYRSMVEYLLALQAYYEHDNNKMIQLLKQSITTYHGHVNNFLLLAKYVDKRDSIYYINKARNNIISNDNKTNETTEYFTDPNNYIGEFISGCLMSKETFDSLTS